MQDEVLKHSKKIYNTIKKPTHTFSEKIKEIAIEIFIIVFAVTLSIWLHSWSEHRHQQMEVKEFLNGLKLDLKETAENAEKASYEYLIVKKRFVFLSSLTKSKKPNQDSLNYYFAEIIYSPNINSNSSKYEGFKSSGKIGLIENKELAQNILIFYNQDLPDYYKSTNGWNMLNTGLNGFIMDNLVENENGTDNRLEVLTMPKAHNLCKRLIPWQQLFDCHEILIQKAEAIIKEIDKENRK